MGGGEWGAAVGGAGALRAGLAYVLLAHADAGGADGVYCRSEGEGGDGGVSLFTAPLEPFRGKHGAWSVEQGAACRVPGDGGCGGSDRAVAVLHEHDGGGAGESD